LGAVVDENVRNRHLPVLLRKRRSQGHIPIPAYVESSFFCLNQKIHIGINDLAKGSA
jgi:hypothetical protein